MSGGGGTKTVQTTSDQSPWKPQQNFLIRGFDEASRLYDQPGPNYYPNSTVAAPGATTQQGWDMGRAMANTNAGLLGQTARGDFLSGGNPYLTGLMGQVGNAIRPQVDSAFAGVGRTGSGAHANAFTSALADQATKLAYQNYGDERQRMLSAQTDYSAPTALMGIGQAQQAADQAQLSDQVARYDYGQNLPYNKLAQYMGIVGDRSYGGTQVSSQPYTGASGLMQGVGTGIAGLSALGQFGQALPGLMRLF